MLNNLQQMRLKLLQRERFKKTAESTMDLIDYKNAYKITKASRSSPRHNSEIFESEAKNTEFDREKHK